MGALLDGYCSDCTRTFAAGELGDEAREVYELVRAAQAAGLGGGRARASTGEEVDEVGARVIRDGGHGEHFGHGLGHGVGLEVHEAPRLGKRSEDALAGRRRRHGRARRLRARASSGSGSRTWSWSPTTGTAT